MTELINDGLKKLLSSLDDHFYYIPNQGNAGDSLITCATLQFFEKSNISYDLILDHDFDATGRTVLYGGGGNFWGAQSRVGRYISKCKDEAKAFILLPHTIIKSENILGNLNGKFHIVCRERVTYNYIKSKAPYANAYLHDDIVFLADLPLLFENIPKVNLFLFLLKELYNRNTQPANDFGLSLRGFKRFLIYQVRKLLVRPPVNSTLSAFRIDCEHTDIELPGNNIDLSEMVALGSCNPYLARLSTYHFLNDISAYSKVHTNRLHIAIAAACLGKKVRLYANNYFKNRAIYEYSIKGKYDNVEWCD